MLSATSLLELLRSPSTRPNLRTGILKLGMISHTGDKPSVFCMHTGEKHSRFLAHLPWTQPSHKHTLEIYLPHLQLVFQVQGLYYTAEDHGYRCRTVGLQGERRLHVTHTGQKPFCQAMFLDSLLFRELRTCSPV